MISRFLSEYDRFIVCYVLAFSCSGTTMNYFLDDRINRAEILFPGVGCFLIAVCLGSIVHASNADDNKTKLTHYFNNNTDEGYILLL